MLQNRQYDGAVNQYKQVFASDPDLFARYITELQQDFKKSGRTKARLLLLLLAGGALEQVPADASFFVLLLLPHFPCLIDPFVAFFPFLLGCPLFESWPVD